MFLYVGPCKCLLALGEVLYSQSASLVPGSILNWVTGEKHDLLLTGNLWLTGTIDPGGIAI